MRLLLLISIALNMILAINLVSTNRAYEIQLEQGQQTLNRLNKVCGRALNPDVREACFRAGGIY